MLEPTKTPRAQVCLLGPLTVAVDGAPAAPGGPRQRMVLAALAARPGQIVAADTLAEAVWGKDSLDRSRGTLQVYVSNLRRVLGDPAAIVARPPGYVLDPDRVGVDVAAFEADVEAGRAAARRGEPAVAVVALRRALGRWHGPFLADLDEVSALADLGAGLSELRLDAHEDCLDAELTLGRHHPVVIELETACRANPLRERLWGMLMLALYRCGRQGDALTTYQRARDVLVDELGVDPGPALRRLERSILDQSGSLDLVPETAPAVLWFDPGGRLRQRALNPAKPLTIGRAEGNDIRLEADSAASRRHASIDHREGHWVAADAASANGTWRNGERIEHAVLTDGDLLRCGDTSLFVRIGHPTVERAADSPDATLLRDPSGATP